MRELEPCIFPRQFAALFPDRLFDWLRTIPGVGEAEELHLRRGGMISLTLGGKTKIAPWYLSDSQFDLILQGLLRDSAYAQEDRLRQGYFLYPGGYRVGIGGRALTSESTVHGVTDISSLCLRLPHRRPGISRPLAHLFLQQGSSGKPSAAGILLYGPPGVGKTTVLRDLCEQLAGEPHYFRSAVIDDRGELFFGRQQPQLNLDLYAAWPKGAGLEAAIRAAAPKLLFCDELDDGDALRLLRIGGGVPLIATAHGGSPAELSCRPGLGKLIRAGRFFCTVGLFRGKNGMGFRYDELSLRKEEMPV